MNRKNFDLSNRKGFLVLCGLILKAEELIKSAFVWLKSNIVKLLMPVCFGVMFYSAGIFDVGILSIKGIFAILLG